MALAYKFSILAILLAFFSCRREHEVPLGWETATVNSLIQPPVIPANQENNTILSDFRNWNTPRYSMVSSEDSRYANRIDANFVNSNGDQLSVTLPENVYNSNTGYFLSSEIDLKIIDEDSVILYGGYRGPVFIKKLNENQYLYFVKDSFGSNFNLNHQFIRNKYQTSLKLVIDIDKVKE